VRGVRTSPDSIVITAGTRHAVEVLGRAIGGPIAVEAYGLFLFREALAAMSLATVPIGIDELGAVVADLGGLPEVTAALLTPAHHFPHGVTLHPARRTAVLEWAHRTGGYLFEDDYDGEFRYDRQPVGAVQGLDPDRVVYLGSSSKSLSPVLRLGWMVLPDDLIDDVVAAQGGQQFYVNGIAQLTMADFISNGSYDKHIRKMRLNYRRRRDRLAEALAPFDVRIGGLSAGLHLMLELPGGSEAEVLRRAGEAGIALSGLAMLRHPDAGPDVPSSDGIVVSFGSPADHEFGRAVDALCRVLADSLRS
jgi:GntR family transcriptional regulator / MocR family aminotransferase